MTFLTGKIKSMPKRKKRVRFCTSKESWIGTDASDCKSRGRQHVCSCRGRPNRRATSMDRLILYYLTRLKSLFANDKEKCSVDKFLSDVSSITMKSSLNNQLSFGKNIIRGSRKRNKRTLQKKNAIEKIIVQALKFAVKEGLMERSGNSFRFTVDWKRPCIQNTNRRCASMSSFNTKDTDCSSLDVSLKTIYNSERTNRSVKSESTFMAPETLQNEPYEQEIKHDGTTRYLKQSAASFEIERKEKMVDIPKNQNVGVWVAKSIEHREISESKKTNCDHSNNDIDENKEMKQFITNESDYDENSTRSEETIKQDRTKGNVVDNSESRELEERKKEIMNRIKKIYCPRRNAPMKRRNCENIVNGINNTNNETEPKKNRKSILKNRYECMK